MDWIHRLAALSAVALLASACVDTPENLSPHSRTVHANLSTDLKHSLASDTFSAQVFAAREGGIVTEASRTGVFYKASSFELDFDVHPDAIGYELRISQEGVRVASAAIDPEIETRRVAAPVNTESTVEADIMLNAVMDGSWCDSCSVSMMRCLVGPQMSEELAARPTTYHDTVATYGHGIARAVGALQEHLEAQPDGAARLERAQTILRRSHAATDIALVTETIRPNAATAQSELEHALSGALRDAGFEPAAMARAGQISAEVLFGGSKNLQPDLIPHALEASERIRWRLVSDYVSERLVDAGADEMEVAGINAAFAEELHQTAEQGESAPYYVEQLWLAFQMASLVTWAEVDPTAISILTILADLVPLDRHAKGVAADLATLSLGEEVDTNAVDRALTQYDEKVGEYVVERSLRDIVFHTSVPAHAVPRLSY